MSEYLFIVQVGWVGLSCDRFMIHVTHLSMHCIFKLLSSSIAFFNIFFNKAYLYNYTNEEEKSTWESQPVWYCEGTYYSFQDRVPLYFSLFLMMLKMVLSKKENEWKHLC